MQVIMTTTQPNQASVVKRLPFKKAPIVAAVKTALPNIGASLDISAVIAQAFTIKRSNRCFVSRDQRYQLRIKVGRNIVEITEVPTMKQVNLKLV